MIIFLPKNFQRGRSKPMLLPRNVESIFNLYKLISDYDIFHFHSFSASNIGLDLPLWKFFGKKIIIHYHGTDIRGKKEKRLYKEFSNKVIVSTPDLLSYISDAIWIPNPIDLEEISVCKVSEKSDKITIVHAPTNRIKKGTKYIINAIKKLKKEGYKAELVIIEKMSHNKAIKYYQQADIIIDQLIIGWYGMFSIECMALGKPVCSFIRNDLESYMPFNPIINTSPKNIVENLKFLIEDETIRESIGKKGRGYVEKVHSADIVTKKVTALYKN
jgi:glycosyltransferase involved in cell wall biosynthesis